MRDGLVISTRFGTLFAAAANFLQSLFTISQKEVSLNVLLPDSILQDCETFALSRTLNLSFLLTAYSIPSKVKNQLLHTCDI